MTVVQVVMQIKSMLTIPLSVSPVDPNMVGLKTIGMLVILTIN